jgi:NTP pyrophosphatase (non-canonical NTP hydrolase)
MDDMLEELIAFNKARDWEQFHNPKDLALSLILEAAEVLEHFQWKNLEEMQEHLRTNRDDVAEELVDVLGWVLLMSHYFEIDLRDAFKRKMAKNIAKYPVNKAKGRHDKYTAYQENKAK